MATTYPVDSIAKTELYDVDMMENLLRHDGVSEDMKKNLRMYKKRRTNGNRVPIQYGFGKGCASLKVGRISPQPHLGLAVFPGDIRASLAQKFYWDIDIVNCQPVICSQLARKFSLATPALDEYIEKREEILDEIKKNHTLTRTEAKDICIAVLFGGTRYEHPILPRIKNELGNLGVFILHERPDIFAMQKAIHATNPIASTIAIYIQSIEQKILSCIDYFISQERRTLDTLIYDGGLIRKLEKEHEPPYELLKKCETFVETNEGYSISLLFKPLTHTFEFTPKQTMKVIDDSYAGSELARLAGNNLRKVGDELFCFNDETGLWGNSEDMLFELVHRHESSLRFIDSTNGKMHNYSGMVNKRKTMLQTLPLYVKPGDLPIQFAYTLTDIEEPPNKLKIIERFEELIYRISNRDEVIKIYILNYLAHILQKPFELPKVALVITGEKRIGKDTPFDFFGKYVIGARYFQNYEGTKQVFDKHDTLSKHKLLVKVEEVDRVSAIANAETIKGWITSSSATFNGKLEKAVSVPNCRRYIFTTNKQSPFEMSQGEARFNITPCFEDRKGDIPYWDETRTLLFNETAGRVIADYLLAIDLKDFHPMKLPENSYLQQVMDVEVSVIERFYDSLENGKWFATEFFTMYREFCIENSYLAVDNQKRFGSELLTLLRNGRLIKSPSTSNRVWYRKGGVTIGG